MTVTARHYQTDRPIRLTFAAGRVAAVEDAPDAAGLPWVAPGLCDLQLNGALGVDFTDPALTAEGVATVVAACRERGVSQFFPTLITADADALQNGFRALAGAIDADADLAHALPGFHLEGPFIAPDDGPRGAHPRAHVRDPDFDLFRRWQEAAGGRIRLITLAPERPGALPLIERLTAAGVVCAIGHTAAAPATIRDAVAAGARLSTHLGNGAHATLPRHPNYLWEQLAADELWASVIADGHHLPASVLRVLFRAKGLNRVVLISDASPLAGLPAGRYRHWGHELELGPTGRIGVAGTPYLAGAGGFLDACVVGAARLGGLTVPEALELAVSRPRELLGLPVPTLEVGQPADVAIIPDHAPPAGSSAHQSSAPAA